MRGLTNNILLAVLISSALAGHYEKLIYYVEPLEQFNWYDAYSECVNKNMSLLKIDSKEKSIIVQKVLDSVFKDGELPNLYIGAHDLGNFREFVWISTGNNLTFENWLPHEPNNHKEGDERCVQIGHLGSSSWNDINCKREFGYICEEKERN